MMIGNSIVTLLSFAPLLLLQLVDADVSPSCPLTYEGSFPPPFDQSCQNSCSTGANAGEIVGPGVLTSGEASKYDVAAIYLGYQN